MTDDALLTVKEAAARAGVSVKTIRRAYGDGQLAVYRPGGRGVYRFLAADVDRWRLQPAPPRRSRPAPSPAPARARRPQVASIDSRRRPEPGSREDLRAIERSTR
jgi:excisionase family DNA binding protein